MPRDRVFFQLFESVSGELVKMGEKLKEVVNEPDFDKRAQLIQEMEDMEHVNDDYTHNIFTELGKNFITPFDREDIHYLATALDDIADYIYASAKKINFYRVDPRDSGFQKLADMIEQSAIQVKNAVIELRDMKNMRLMREALLSKSVSATTAFKILAILVLLSAIFSNSSKNTLFFGVNIFRNEFKPILLDFRLNRTVCEISRFRSAGLSFFG